MSAISGQRALGRPVTGPTALGHDPRRFWRLTWTLAVTQFRLKFYGSVLGYLWQLMRPLMLFSVLYVVFTLAIRLGGGIEFFPVVLLAGIVLFVFFSEALSSSVGSLVEREPLLRKIEFPRMAVPCAVVLTAFMNLSLNLVVVVFFAAVSGVELHASLVQAPLILAALGAFALGLGLLASSLYVRYRDIAPITDVSLQMFFYGSAIIFPIEALPEEARPWLMLNPFAAIVQQVRHAAIDPSAPSAFEIGGWQTGAALLIVAGVLVAGFLVFRRRAPYVAEEL
jgi:ABC-2 type transport system permease protein